MPHMASDDLAGTAATRVMVTLPSPRAVPGRMIDTIEHKMT
jgi:hypothetical protein